MKVLKNNYNYNKNENNIISTPKPYPRTHICEKCKSELEYDKSDLRMGFLGCMHLDCPICGESNMLDENEFSITLTPNNVEFPTHFWHTSKETGAVETCNNKNVKKYIQEGIEFLRNNKDEFSWFYQSGNLYIEICKLIGDEVYDITVSNNYYSTEIPFEAEDY